ncbi:hypothetical protein E4U43_000539 [Claviceps pusilla]|uniref:Uncharacterized protein n=1 Tax=Claviceps pusilla TaxID=123648 RepID=A0A9P7NBR9_9HYPO|nr:hypothetical protein E4U43_000539 [Claviceps pusilla]
MNPPQNETAPLAGRFIAIIVSLLSTTVLTMFLTQRCLAIRYWSRVPVVMWLVLAIYVDSYLFVIGSALLQNTLGANYNMKTCDSAILMCLVCYVTTKHIIRGACKKRSRSKLYLFNSVGMVGVYSFIVILNFVFRIAKLEKGECIIGMETIAMVPLISFDAFVNLYLTIIFIIPLRQLYSYKNMQRTPATIRLRSVAFRTFGGAVCSLISSITNLSVLMSLDGEPGWMCLMCCNCDILFSAVVIQWVTSKDNAGTSRVTSSTEYYAGRDSQGPSSSSSRDLASGARISPAPSTPRDSALMPLSRLEDRSTNTMQADRGGVMVTTTIETETETETEPQEIHRKQDKYADAEEGRVEFDSPFRNGDFSGSRTSIVSGHGTTEGLLTRPSRSMHA